MTVAQFETVSLYLGIGGLIAYMIFIMFRLAQDSGAGHMGTLVIFLSLGLGITGFAAKSLIQWMIGV